MIDVKVSIRGAGPDVDLSEFTGNSNSTIDGCRFHVNSSRKEADVWLVIEEPEPGDQACLVPPGRVVHLAAEPARPIGFISESPGVLEYLRQFDVCYTFLDNVLANSRYDLPFLPWMINANHGPSIFGSHERDVNFFRGLQSLPKTHEISVFCSSQDATPEHRMRLRFVQALTEHFRGRIDWFGNGFRSIPQKWDGLAPYKYTIVLENQSAAHVVTEKVQDAFLALSFPIYWGAPDIEDYFPSNSLLAIDAKDLKGSIDAIECLLDEDPYEHRLDALIEAKRMVTDEHNLAVRLARIANEVVRSEADVTRKQLREVKLESQIIPKSLKTYLGRSLLRGSSIATRTGRNFMKT